MRIIHTLWDSNEVRDRMRKLQRTPVHLYKGHYQGLGEMEEPELC
jgi:hypothetical protein